MLSLLYARRRLEAALEEIKRLFESEFAYRASEDALEILEKIIRGQLTILESLESASEQVVNQECASALKALFDYTPLLGFILRSTNVRNAFEIVGPLLDLAGRVLEPDVVSPLDRRTRLILSSEWNYSPVTYPKITALPDFVLIGLPAPESANPLLTPLAGHELGHTVWVTKGYEKQFKGSLKAGVADAIAANWGKYSVHFPGMTAAPEKKKMLENIFVVKTVDRALSWTAKQAKEMFCDFLGLRLFGESFLHAFAYLLSPNNSTCRSPNYPNMLTRVRHLRYAARRYSVPVPRGYKTLFKDRPTPDMRPEDEFLLSIADKALKKIVPELVAEVAKIATESRIPLSTEKEVTRIIKRFQLLVPPEKVSSLADILNAAWRAYAIPDLWAKYPEIAKQKHRVLGELVLKSIEVFHMEHLPQKAP